MTQAIQVRPIEVTVTTLSPLHIGGRDDVFADVHGRVARMGDRVVIPGPSFKGACRYSLEKILISQYADQQEMKPCIPAPGREVTADEKRLNKIYRTDGGCTYDKDPSICPACYLFGAQSLGGMVYIPFLTSGCRPQDLYSLRLDRALGVGAGGNREYEFVPEGVGFTGTVEVLLQDGFRRWELGKARPLAKKKNGIQADVWLASKSWTSEDIISRLLLPAMQGIDQMGGFRSKGFGRVKVEVKPGQIVERGPKVAVGGGS